MNDSQLPQQLTLEQLQASGAKLTPEQEEEIKLRSKYPNPQKPGGSAFIQKMLHKGNKKYFDSGDYNMAKSKSKALNSGNKSSIPSGMTTSGLAQQTNTSVIQNEHQPSPLSNEFNSPTIVLVENQPEQFSSSVVSNDSNSQIKTPINSHQTPLITTTNIISNSTSTTTNLSSNIPSISPSSLSSSVSSSNINANQCFLNANNQMSNSLSTQSITMISSSISSDKLSTVQINTTDPVSILDSEEIGHGIPTPECLPSRKHSIVQSKLATPRLSS